MATAIFRCKFNIQRLNHLQHLLYSTNSQNQITNSPNQFFINYLVNNLGFSHQLALSTSAKLRYMKVNDFNSSDNADSVVRLFKQHGFHDTHIIKVVSSYPRILHANVDKTLVPKFKHLQDLGFSGSNLIRIISSNSEFLKSNMDTIHDVKAILGSNENLIKFFRKSPFNVSTFGLVNLKSNIALLNNEYGFDIQVIQNSILYYPTSYLRNTQYFRDILVRVEEELGIPRNSRMFLYGVYMLCKLSKKKIDSQCQLLKSFGWTEYDVSELIKRNPMVLQLSEENFTKKLGFLMTELDFKPDYLAKHSGLFTYSLEKRMEPRCRVLMVLKEKGLLNYNFFSAIYQTETRFVNIFIEPFKEDVPGLLQLYQKSKSCSTVDAVAR